VPAIPQQSSPHRSPSAPNGIAHESNVPNGDTDVKLSVPVAINVGAQAQADDAMQIDSQPQNIAITSPVRPKSQTPSMTAIPNGFTIPSVNNFSSHIAANGSAYSHYAGMRNGIMAKSALAATLAGQDGGNGGHLRQTPSYMPHGVNYASQLQAARQMQYAALQQRQQTRQPQPRAVVSGPRAGNGCRPGSCVAWCSAPRPHDTPSAALPAESTESRPAARLAAASYAFSFVAGSPDRWQF
jgi:enhancer of polycomb-like protein